MDLRGAGTVVHDMHGADASIKARQGDQNKEQLVRVSAHIHTVGVAALIEEHQSGSGIRSAMFM